MKIADTSFNKASGMKIEKDPKICKRVPVH